MLVALLGSSCGQDAEKQYAGLDALTVRVAGGPGYRVRYLHPPWERVPDDPLERGQVTVVPFGASAHCELAENTCREVERKSARVLEIERSSISQSTTMRYPKYRLEAALVRCGLLELPAQDQCADVLAREDELGRKRAESDDDVLYARDGENDAGQPYREIVSRSRATRRYRRVVYFATEQRELAFRLFIEATPSVVETEVTRMVAACEVLDSERVASDDDGGSAP